VFATLRGNDEELAVQCGLSFRFGLITAGLLQIYEKFGTQITSYARRVHKTLHQKRYCIGWRLHNYDGTSSHVE